MDLLAFKSWALSQGSVDKYQGSNKSELKGQCVSLINQYCWRVLNVPADAWGHAAAWANTNNADVAKHFERVPTVAPGDILVYPGMSVPYGHIEIAMPGGYALGQNGRRALQVTYGAMYSNPVILRVKGESDMIQAQDVVQLRIANSEVKGWDRTAVHAGKLDEREINAWKGQPWTKFLQQAWEEGAAYRALKDEYESFYRTYAPRIAEFESRPTKESFDKLIDELKLKQNDVLVCQQTLSKTQIHQLADKPVQSKPTNWITKLIQSIFSN